LEISTLLPLVIVGLGLILFAVLLVRLRPYAWMASAPRASKTSGPEKMADEQQRRYLEELLQKNQQRLHIMEEQAANFGPQYVPPYILLDIKATQSEIARIKAELQADPGESSAWMASAPRRGD